MPALALDGWTFCLVLARVLPVCWALTTLTDELIPKPVALSLALALAASLCPIVEPVSLPPDVATIALAVLRALSIGGVFALALALALLSISWSVRISAVQGSLSQVAPLARLYGLCAAWLSLSLGGLRAVMIALAESFHDATLVGTKLDGKQLALGAAQLVADAFAASLGFALPLLLSVWLLEAVLSLIGRVFAPAAAGQPVMRPLVFFAAAALLLVPIASRAPEAVRTSITSARVLTRALAK